MENMKNLCAPIPEALHTQVMQEKERLGQTLSEYVQQVLNEHFNRKDGKTMGNTRPMAIQLPEELFLQLKEYLKRHGLKQKDFVIGLIEKALAEDKVPEQTAE
jgi:predicted DNA binding CopG/RHH family protein